MTLLEVTYELQKPLSSEQVRRLSEFANLYGLRSFRVDESNKLVTFEYDASRLRETQVSHALRAVRIPVQRRVEPVTP